VSRAAAAAALAWLASLGTAHALSIEPAPPALPSLEIPEGVTPWDVLGKTAVIFDEKNGQETVTTIVPPEVEGLDGTDVSLMGYMVPIEAQPEAQHFLLAELPADCPFCLAGTVDWSRMVEVSLDAPTAWRDKAVMLAGRLEVVHDDPYGVVYRLHQARLLP
jgi:hypothetical protein